MKLYTVQLSKKKKASMPVENITEKSENSPIKKIVPNFDMISAYMHGKMSEEEYHEKYVTILDENKEPLMKHFRHLATLPGYDRLALACDCKPGHFCQRVLLAEWLAKHLGWDYEGEIE